MQVGKDGKVQFGDDQFHLPQFNKQAIISVAIIVILAIFIFSSFYTIKTDEIGVIKRFGKYLNTANPGLHFKLPFGIDTIIKLKGSNFIFPVEFGYRTVRPGVQSEIQKGRRFEQESLMLTGDLNCAVVTWVVQYRITDPANYLFKVRGTPREGPINTFRDVSEAVMRKIVGDHSVDEVIILKRRQIAQQVKEEMQEIFNQYEMGVAVENVELQDVNPPDPVKPSFNEVNASRQEMEKALNQAYEAYNKVIPKAKGEAEKTIKQAEGYALDRVNRAQGDANKFIAVYQAYRSSKDVTRRRMYIETMNDILPKIQQKYIVDEDMKGILPLLQLNNQGGGNK
ncbi:FtsH protease activity modulator HflK [candidate division KSB1 bacterium]|nr:FtsH protease activity modulator HflK [candidate division KSB1 bacterium]